MAKAISLHEGVIRPSLVAELEAFRAPSGRVSSYYLDLDPRHWGSTEAMRLAVKNALAAQRERLGQIEAGHAVRQALLRDLEQVHELAMSALGQRGTRTLACFVASEQRYTRALRLPWPGRDRVFFEDLFVLWPLQQMLDQADRYAVCVTTKDKARLFLFYMEQIEEVSAVFDEIPGKIRFPDPIRVLAYMHKHVEHFHHHFEHVAEEALRLLQREPFEHLIIGGRRETLPQFESHLHRYLRDRIVARWEIDVHTPTPQVLERAQKEEEHFLERQAQEIWKSIQEQRPARGALGPEEVFAALWQRRAQALLVEPGVKRPGFRCTACGRLQLSAGPCVECGANKADVPDVYEEAVHETIEQSGQVRFWKDLGTKGVDGIAALKRF